jgi:hypothetical protein
MTRGGRGRGFTRSVVLVGLPVTAALLVACGGPGAVGSLRFHNREPVWRVNDRRETPQPAPNRFAEKLYFFDAFFFRRLTRAMEVPAPRRAADINSLDEVPDSTWFTNRIGVRDVTLAEIARGPNTDDGPDRSRPLQVTGSKIGGGSVGITVADARGIRFILKFDEPAYPVMETATDVAVQRLLWACGYNVPENTIVFLARADLQLAADATVKDVFGNRRPMTEVDLDDALRRVHVRADGTYRTLASKLLPGVPLGGIPQEGVRADDVNDRVLHQHRRVLRGLYLFFSWVQQTDAKEDNTLDMWITNSGRHYVSHYLVDFGKSFGTSAFIVKRPGDGHVYNIDFDFIIRSLPTFGLWRRPWEGTPDPPLPGVGVFDSAHFDPGRWRPHAPYAPFAHKDIHDMFWAAKIMIRLSPQLIRTALAQGKFDDPRAVEYLTQILVERQRRAARYWFRRVNPLDRFVVVERDGAVDVCFDDLLVVHGLEPGAGPATVYRATSYDFAGVPLGFSAVAAGADRTACVVGIPLATDHDGYTIVRLDTTRWRRALPPVEAHLARDPASGRVRLIGLNRR